ncbi:PREDICTED: integumentary mucin A.1-like [Branchiostoma belcheri]|uniref:Integumentary mucin A.1-like n=1 Tax=Branchiostoma belcheri TaxID=7741 RepID=A0A6P4ZVE2_BRABE|nr:PREDICTED: integumentary mucin A.1-like [Branchiostoma belcheri]
MPPAIFFPLLFLLACAAEGRVLLTGCLYSDGQVYPPGEFSPDRCTSCTCMATQVSAGRYKYRPKCISTCNHDARDTRTTTPTTTFWTTTTQQLPCWAYLKFTCPDLDCQGHGSVPHDYHNCRCGYCICPTDPSSGTTSRPWSCPTTVYTTVPTTTPTTTTALTTPTTTVPTTTVPITTITTRPWACWLQSWRFTCPYNKPCVDATPDDYSNCSCGHCPNGPNCYAWDGSIIPAGEAVEVDGATCQCPDHSSYANCDVGTLTG